MSHQITPEQMVLAEKPKQTFTISIKTKILKFFERENVPVSNFDQIGKNVF
jgi:hypothetical protein